MPLQTDVSARGRPSARVPARPLRVGVASFSHGPLGVAKGVGALAGRRRRLDEERAAGALLDGGGDSQPEVLWRIALPAYTFRLKHGEARTRTHAVQPLVRKVRLCRWEGVREGH